MLNATVVIGRRVREARRDAELTQRELGQRLGWFPQAVSAAEDGRRAWTVDDVMAVASALGRPLLWFYEPLSGEPIASEQSDPEAIAREIRRLSGALVRAMAS